MCHRDSRLTVISGTDHVYFSYNVVCPRLIVQTLTYSLGIHIPIAAATIPTAMTRVNAASPVAIAI